MLSLAISSPTVNICSTPDNTPQRQGLKVGAFGKERLVYHMDYVVHEDLGFCRYLAYEFLEDDEANPDEIVLEFEVRWG